MGQNTQPQIVEQDGNLFKLDGGKYHPMPSIVEQDGHQFSLNATTGGYEYSPPQDDGSSSK